MLKSAAAIRLTRPELDRWSRITGFEPVDVRTVDELRRYVAACKRYYWGSSDETRFLYWLMDEEAARCMAGLLMTAR